MSPRAKAWILSSLTVAGCVAIALGFTVPMIWGCPVGAPRSACGWLFFHPGGTDDWRYFANAWEAARVALTDFHQFPSWNPYHCGGLVLFQDPQSPFPGPLFLLTYSWLPAPAAMKLWVILHLIAGALGACALVRDMRGNVAEQLVAAVIVTACGFCAEHFGGGHLSFTPFLLLPWALWAHRRAMRDARWAVLVAAILALCVYEGATYPLPLILVTLGFDTLLRLGNADDRRGLWISLPVMGVLFPLLAAFRLVPILRYLAEHPRLVPLDDHMSVAEVFQTWLTRGHDRYFPGHVFVWPEYGDYIGLVPVALMLAGLAVAFARHDDQRRMRVINATMFALLVWCVLGNLPGFSLFGLLHELPIYRSLRVPSRFLHPATVMVALVATSALIAAREHAEQRDVRVGWLRGFVAAEVLLAFAIGVDMSVTNGPRLQQGVDPELPHVRASADFFQEAYGNYGLIPSSPTRGRGIRQCYVPLEWQAAPGLWDGAGAQFRIVGDSAGTARLARWSPNAITFDVRLTHRATLIVNQNYESSWRASAGRLTRRDGALAVDLPAGRRRVTLEHSPSGLRRGALLSLLGVLLSALFVWRVKPERVDAMRARVGRWFTRNG